MDNTASVRLSQRVGDLASPESYLFDRLGRAAILPQRGPAHQLHGDRHRRTGANHFVHRDNVRVVQGRCRLRLTNEPFGAGSLGLRGDHFQGRFAVEVGVVSRIDSTHSPLADKAGDHKPAERGAVRKAARGRHRRRDMWMTLLRESHPHRMPSAFRPTSPAPYPRFPDPGRRSWIYCRLSGFRKRRGRLVDCECQLPALVRHGPASQRKHPPASFGRKSNGARR